MARFACFLLALLTLAAPARADDISAAGRSVVRVVVVTLEDGEVVDFGHGSGFAVAPNRIVTNAHVVQLAAQYPQATAVGVVPSEGSQSYGARIVALDPRRDLALLEIEEGSVPAIPLYGGPMEEGQPVAALGYPGNVDLATAQSAADYITPLPPTRSIGIFSNVRPVNGVTTLLHTASIARGHSGGPLLDACGRVLGVNTLITRADEGDAPFFFAVANSEVAAFLREAGQPLRTVGAECVSMAESLREEEERARYEALARQDEIEARQRSEREAREQALARIEESRETRLGIAVLLLVMSLVAFGAGGIMLLKDRQKPAAILGGAGALLLAAAAFAFFSRPGRDEIESIQAEEKGSPGASADRFAGRNICRLVPGRSRITVTSIEEVTLDWSEQGCVNGRTQYAPNGPVWTRILVPAEEQTVTVAEFNPSNGEYVVSRYLLDAEAMRQARELRENVELKTCTADQEARLILSDRQREIRGVLPEFPNERLVFECESAPDAEPPAEET